MIGFTCATITTFFLTQTALLPFLISSLLGLSSLMGFSEALIRFHQPHPEATAASARAVDFYWTRDLYLNSTLYARIRLKDPTVETFQKIPTPNFTFVPRLCRHMGYGQHLYRDAGEFVEALGYQFYKVGPNTISFMGISNFPAGDFINPEFLRGKTFLDVGANNGGWCVVALYLGASHVTGVEMDGNSFSVMRYVREKFHLENVWDIHQVKIGEFNGSADIVNAVGVLHWLAGHSEGDTLEHAIQNLRRVTRHLLLIEWIDHRDHRIRTGKIRIANHTRYSISWFRILLSHYFTDWVELGDTGGYATTWNHGHLLYSHRHRAYYAASVGWKIDSAALRRTRRHHVVERIDTSLRASELLTTRL